MPGVTLPRDLRPMLATAGPLPPEDGRWSYEVKWDGVRALVAVEAGQVALTSRAGNDATASYPELTAAPPGPDLLLDGEVVAFGPEGRPDFGLLQARMHVGQPSAHLRAQVPVVLVVFDVLQVADRPLLAEPYAARRERLDALGLEAGSWLVPPSFPAEGAALLASTREQGLEGVVAKRTDSPYLPGRRSETWVKVKNVRRQSGVVVGWQPGQGGRAGQLGSLLLAVQQDGALVFAGHVGTGFSSAVLRQLVDLLATLETDRPACEVPRLHARTARWVRPELVVDVDFSSWTREGRLRHPSYAGLREDLDPSEVVREWQA